MALTSGRPTFSNVQLKMLKVLADGMPHTRDELHACLWDEKGKKTNIHPHLSGIRKAIRDRGQDIICELFDNYPHFRHIVLLTSCTCRPPIL